MAKIGPISSISPSLATDQSWGGVALTWTVDTNSVGFGAILRPGASGDLVEADNAETQYPGLFLALEAGTGERRVLSWGGGLVRNDAWAWTPGAALYISTTDGELTQVDTGGHAVGFAKSADVIYFGPVHAAFSSLAPAEITITISGVDFEAIATLDTDTYPDATINWVFPDASESTSLHPDVSGVGAGDVVLTVSDGRALKYLSLGYDGVDGGATFEGGFGAADGPYALAQQNVTAIAGLSSAVGLSHLALSRNPITVLALGGNAALEVVECYGCDIETITVPPNAKRLCVEANALSGTLNMVDCSPTIEDFRAASQSGVGITAITWAAAGAPNLWHWCSHHNALTALPNMTLFPALIDLYLEDNAIAGGITLDGGNLATARLYNNQITGLNAAGSCRAGAASSITVQNNPLASLDVSGNAYLGNMDASECLLNAAAVDAVLAQMAANGNTGLGAQTLDIENNAVPSAAGLSSIATLEGMGWTVTVDTGDVPVPTVGTFDPLDDAVDVSLTKTFGLTFNVPVTAGTGDLRVYNASDTLIDTVSASDVTGLGTANVTWQFTGMLNEVGHYIQIDADAFQNSESEFYAGISDTTSWSFTTVAASGPLLTLDFAGDGVDTDWQSPGAAILTRVSGQGVLTGGSGYQQCYHELSTITCPADVSVQFEFPYTEYNNTFAGISLRYDVTSTERGTRVFFGASPGVIRVGDASDYNANDVTVTVTGGLPATWGQAGYNGGMHKFKVAVVGTAVTVTLNDEEYGTATHNVNNQAGLGIAFVGQTSGRIRDNVVIEAAS